MAATSQVTLARWDGPSPSVDEWMDGRARILHYGSTVEDRITVITVAGQSTQQLSDEDGVAPTSVADAMHAAVTAAVDIAFRAAADKTVMDRERAKVILTAPEEQLDWRPFALHFAGGPRPGFRTVLDGAVAAYVEAENDGVFIGLAAASAVPVEQLTLNFTSL